MAVIKTKIYSIIKKTRKAAGLSQKELADLAGVGKTVIYDIENGKETIRFNTLLSVCNALNINFEIKAPGLE
jgi:y4mF family transcriptional regulator